MKRLSLRSLVSQVVAAAMLCTVCLPAQAQPLDYNLRYGDALSISIVGQPDLSVTGQMIRPDGRISLPLVQEVYLEGKTVQETTALLTKAYRSFFVNPHVVVSVAKFRPVKVTLLGQVAHPGTFNFDAPPTLLDVLATAGGLTDRAAKNTIKVIVPAQEAKIYDLDRLLSGSAAIPMLQEGTVVEVGEVWGPDWYRVLPILASVITAGALLSREWYW